MSILMALVENRHEEAGREASLLARTVEAGDMAKVDEQSQRLISFINPESRIEIPETLWRSFLAVMRNTKIDFASSYLLDKAAVEKIVSADLGKDFASIYSLAEKALEKNALLLELPHAEESGEDADYA